MWLTDIDMEPPKKNVFCRVMTIFKNGRHFEPEVEFIFNVSVIKWCFLDHTTINFIGYNDCSLCKEKTIFQIYKRSIYLES